jgi:hypothetical protein
MEGACTDLNIVGLMNDAAFRCPVILQGQYKLLKCQIISSVRKTEKESECTKKNRVLLYKNTLPCQANMGLFRGFIDVYPVGGMG